MLDPDRCGAHHLRVLSLTLQHFLTIPKTYLKITPPQAAQTVEI